MRSGHDSVSKLKGSKLVPPVLVSSEPPSFWVLGLPAIW